MAQSISRKAKKDAFFFFFLALARLSVCHPCFMSDELVRQLQSGGQVLMHERLHGNVANLHAPGADVSCALRKHG